MKTILQIFAVLMLFVTILYSMQIVGNEVYDNQNLDIDSVTLIDSYNNRIENNFNYSSSFGETSSNLTNVTNFDSEDVFAQQYLEGKSESQKKQGIIKNIINIPDMIILSFGVAEEDVLIYKTIMILIISILIGFAGFRLVFGQGRID